MYTAFNGCFPSVLTCTNCKNESSNNAENTSIVLEPLVPRSDGQVIPLMDKLKEYFASEKVEWKCDKCNKSNKAAIKKVTMTVGPEYLIVNIARHKPMRAAWRKGTKVRNRVEFPEKLQMPVTGKGGREKYELASVVAHLGGTMTSGNSTSLSIRESTINKVHQVTTSLTSSNQTTPGHAATIQP